MIRRWAERLAALACVAAVVGGIGWLLVTVPWAWAIWLGASLAFGLGWVCGVAVVRGKTQATDDSGTDWRAEAQAWWRQAQSWRQKADAWEAYADAQDDELRAKDAELAKADATIARLNEQISAVFEAGLVEGQVLQADREGNGL